MEGDEEFFRDYFVQTRREIDTEKQERDNLLRFAVTVLGIMTTLFGGVIGALAAGDKAIGKEVAENIFSSWWFYSAAVCLVFGVYPAIMWLLMSLRTLKLIQIADRWFTLYCLLLLHADDLRNRKEFTKCSLELKAIQWFACGDRYVANDLRAALVFVIPIEIFAMIVILSILYANIHGNLCGHLLLIALMVLAMAIYVFLARATMRSNEDHIESLNSNINRKKDEVILKSK